MIQTNILEYLEKTVKEVPDKLPIPMENMD